MSSDKILKRIGFLLSYDFHIHFFQTVIDELKRHPKEFEIYVESTVENLKQRHVDIIFFASGYGLKEFPRATKIQVFHSCLISKGVQYHPLHKENDFIVTTSTKETEIYKQHGTEPKMAFLPFGNTQTDLLFRAPKLSHKDLGLDPNVPTILYAPTFTKELTSISSFKNNLVRILRGSNNEKRNIIIKVHPAINTSNKVIQKKFPGRLSTFKMWQGWFEEAERQEGVHFVHDFDEDITEYMKLSDVLVGDVSGVNFIWLATGKPMILFNSWRTILARVKNFLHLPSYFDANGPEWMYRRKMGYQSYSTSKVSELIKKALKSDPMKKERENLISILFDSNADGNTGKRIVEHIRETPHS